MVSTAVESLQSAKAQLLTKISGLENEVKQIESVIAALETLNGGDAAAVPAPVVATTGSDARLVALAKARAARWANYKLAEAPAQSGKRVISAATKAKMKKAQQARWAKINAAKASSTTAAPEVAAKPAKKKTMSAAARKAIGAAVAARWAKVRAAKAKAAKKK